jgi:hypothetical protein
VSAAVFAESTKRELWSWKDSDGVVHYSDRPVPGAKRIEIATMTPESAPPPAPPVTTPSGAPKAAAPVDQYEVLEIYAPEDGESFFGLESQVTVRVRSDPELIPGHQLRVFIDSQPGRKRPDRLRRDARTVRTRRALGHGADRRREWQAAGPERVAHVLHQAAWSEQVGERRAGVEAEASAAEAETDRTQGGSVNQRFPRFDAETPTFADETRRGR